jgi:hypothetical protein
MDLLNMHIVVKRLWQHVWGDPKLFVNIHHMLLLACMDKQVYKLDHIVTIQH